MLVQAKDKDGNLILNPDGSPLMVWVDVPNGAPNGQQNGAGFVSKEEAERNAKALADKARDDEKRKQRADLDRVNKERDDLEARLKKIEDDKKAAELAALPKDQQVIARLASMESELARERGERLQAEQTYQQSLRQVGLVAYRERALRDVPEEVHNLVQGQTEEDIDKAADEACNVYVNLETKLRTQLQQDYSQRYPAPPGGQPQGVPAPPQSPHYVAPPSPAYGVPQGGFPTATNPLPIPADGGGPPDDLGTLTTEQAVRSGRYGGELRNQIHDRLKAGMRYQGNLGSAPRHWSQANPQTTPHVEMPGGVQQPQGFQTGPVQNPGLAPQQRPQGQPVVPQQQGRPGSPREAARAAIARQRAGQNPVLGHPSNMGAPEAAHEAQQFANQRGISPEQTFASRFANTPPAAQQ
jgi:hypothetical protein